MKKDKAEVLAKAYIENKFNGAKTIKQVMGDDVIAPDNKAYQMLRQKEFRTELARILNEQGITQEKISKILGRNMNQSKNYNASNTAIDMAIKVYGGYAPERSIGLNIQANLPSTPEGLQKALNELQQELAMLDSNHRHDVPPGVNEGGEVDQANAPATQQNE
jgi:hypothetical protein